MEFAKYMATPTGRAARIVLGLVLIAIGLGSLGGTSGWILALIGLVPIGAGILNWCLLAPLLGAPLKGADLPK